MGDPLKKRLGRFFLIHTFHYLWSSFQSSLGAENTCKSCTLRTQWGSTDTLNVVTRDIFAVWWYPQFDHTEDANVALDKLIAVRNDCIDNLGMADPPNPGNGNFFNIYIHHDDKDDFPNGWAQGIGTDKFKNPFYTMPGANGMYSRSIYHEGFHIFQYTGSRDPENPGFAYHGDTMWYVESSANWYMAQWYKGEKAYITAGTIVANPHLALWHGKDNMSPLDPVVPGHYNASEWMYGVRRYGMHTLLSFLTDVKGVDKPTIVDGYYAKTNQSPQEYLYRNIGPDTFRSHFADWAAHNTAGLETYLTKEQVDRAYLEISLAGDWNYYRPAVWYAENTGTDGEWVQPEEEFIAYNVLKVKVVKVLQLIFWVKLL